jgi:hypothetical protein
LEKNMRLKFPENNTREPYEIPLTQAILVRPIEDVGLLPSGIVCEIPREHALRLVRQKLATVVGDLGAVADVTVDECDVDMPCCHFDWFDNGQTLGYRKRIIVRMEPRSELRIVEAERLKEGLLVTFDDGRCGLYPASLLETHLSQVGVVPESAIDDGV